MDSVALNPYSIYRTQATPALVVVFALGLCSTEDSPYVEDLLRQLPKNVMIITVRGEETSGHHEQHKKFFLKNDPSRVLAACVLAKKIAPTCPVVGLGMSLGGALILRAHQKTQGTLFRGIIIMCTSLWYENALQTMQSSLKGHIVNRLLVWWQFKSLFWTPNYLHHTSMRFWDWIKLFFASSMLEQDSVLCKAYGIDYREYLNSLDLRRLVRACPRVYYLASRNDPMFSAEHMRETEAALHGSSVNATLTTIGKHGEFSIDTRNDYLVDYVTKCIDELSFQE